MSDATEGPTDLDYRRAVDADEHEQRVERDRGDRVRGHAVRQSLDTERRHHRDTSREPRHRAAGMADTVQQGRVFALSFLAADQQPLSDHFADEDRGFGLEEFTDVDTHAGVTGAPLLDGASAWLDCEVHDVLPGGDHLLVLGRVVHTAIADDADSALLYTPDGYDTWTH